MNARPRYQVPLAELDAVEVGREEQVLLQPVPRPAVAAPPTGWLPGHADGGGAGTGGCAGGADDGD